MQHPHTHTVIFLHGRDSTATNLSEDLLDGRDARGRHLQDIFPSVRWVFAQSDKQTSEPLGREIHQWFDISDLKNPDQRQDLQVGGLRQNTAKLIQLIRNEATTVGGLRRVILAGFCQGFAVAVHALLNYLPDPGGEASESRTESAPELEPDNKLGALIGLSSWMPLPAASVSECRERLELQLDGNGDDASASASVSHDSDIYRNTPVFLTHSANDDIVPVEQGRRLRDILGSYGMDVTYLEYERGGHWIYGRQEVDDIVNFLKRQGLPEHVAPDEPSPSIEVGDFL
ncbi:hypothetical protein SLS62_004634 [Diatrype stigma]|uniref:Phospholipase/carboxylesterase/thioesterase domain-containing protein n=1 Tax=Diatrype stigma TaxID=117547 RepID=A0AAN9V2K9_9PEZI